VSASEAVTVTIDGLPVRVPRTATVLQAAEQAGVVVPRYCYHPAFTAPAVCRMCLVEVKGAPKLVPSCVHRAQEGMEVLTDSPAARKARRSVIEFLLYNHPLDCPICDAAGQCELQDYAYETGQLRRRAVEPKRVLGRDKVTPEIVLFKDRCVLCTRCVRFMTEIAQEPALQVVQRGNRAYIDTADGVFEHPFSMNIVDVCPVGALVNEDYLFKARAWDLDRTPSICPGCSQGCNITLDTKDEQVVRAKPRANPEVNAYWMCDHGRRLLAGWHPGERLEAPLVREGGGSDRLVSTDWPAALERAAEGLRRGGGVKAIVSAASANESLYALRRALDAVGTPADGVFRVPQGEEAELKGFPRLRLRKDRVSNATGAELLGFRRADDVVAHVTGHAGAVVVLEDALWDAPEGFAAGAAFHLHVGSVGSPAARAADVVLPVTTFAEMEGTFTNHEGRVQRFQPALRPPGMARPAWLVLSLVAARLGQGLGDLRTAADVFAALAADGPPFAGLTYETIAWRGALVHGRAEKAPAAAE
jgi:NADH-quinone oxidoreductase subunit G